MKRPLRRQSQALQSDAHWEDKKLQTEVYTEYMENFFHHEDFEGLEQVVLRFYAPSVHGGFHN